LQSYQKEGKLINGRWSVVLPPDRLNGLATALRKMEVWKLGQVKWEIRKTLGLCGSEVFESGQLPCRDVYSQGLFNGLDRMEAALFERGEHALEDRLG